ncbi:MAG: hypothetical protein RLZZ306_3171, partial [Bacteroidota bacterium]
MLIKSLSLKDFKCFEQVDIDFGKITLLTGANSSGKSSLIYALLGIMQSKYFPQYFALNGELINMGGFDEVLRKKAEKREFEIGIVCKNPGMVNPKHIDRINTKWIEEIDSQQPELTYFKDDKGVIYQDDDGLAFIDINTSSSIYWMFKPNEVEDFIKKNPLIKASLVENNISGQSSIYHLQGKSTDSLKDFIKQSNFHGGFLNEISFIDINFFNYIGSFRLPPERTYYRKPSANTIGVNGEGYIDQIIEWEESDKVKYNELIEAITEMGLFKTIRANKMKGGRFELNVQVNENSELASLTDVGFGISQFLPIIVADLQMGDDSCLAISQPEIHLHPKIQATLGDYFSKQVNNTDKQYIVETHSEYLINRMRLLIVKGELKPEDVKLYYM